LIQNEVTLEWTANPDVTDAVLQQTIPAHDEPVEEQVAKPVVELVAEPADEPVAEPVVIPADEQVTPTDHHVDTLNPNKCSRMIKSKGTTRQCMRNVKSGGLCSAHGG
jgi:hypothetical protein